MFKKTRGWVWGAKDRSPTPMNFVVRSRNPDDIREKVRLTLELSVIYPSHVDLVDGLVNAHLTFDLPSGIDMEDVKLTHLEVLEQLRNVEV